MKKYCAIQFRHEPGKFIVASIGPCGDFHPLGNVRAFTSFDEANEVALAISKGEYGYTPGTYINMR